MKKKIKIYVIVILTLGIYAAACFAESSKPNPQVTVSSIVYQGPKNEVMVSTIVYKGKKISVGKALSPNAVVQQASLGQGFNIGTLVPLKVSMASNSKPDLIFEFQQFNDRKWLNIRLPKISGNNILRGAGKVTVTRYVKFEKAGKYRWRCRLNKGMWSGWSDSLNITEQAAGKKTIKSTGPAASTKKNNMRIHK